MKKILLLIVVVFYLCNLRGYAQTGLSQGNLAVIGMNGDPDPSTTIHSFAVVALNTINTGELIYFTDRGWVNAYVSTPSYFVE